VTGTTIRLRTVVVAALVMLACLAVLVVALQSDPGVVVGKRNLGGSKTYVKIREDGHRDADWVLTDFVSYNRCHVGDRWPDCKD
jgi:hypothetical protein